MSLLIENVRKTYREPSGAVLPVLNVDQFEIARGEQVVLLGSSGGGKTTLLNIVSGITMPPGDLRSSSNRLMMTRSCKGRRFM